MGWRAFSRIQTTSNAVHAAVPASTSSIGRGAEVASTGIGRAVDDDRVPAAGLRDEADAVRPISRVLSSLRRLRKLSKCESVPTFSAYASMRAIGLDNAMRAAPDPLALCGAIWNPYTRLRLRRPSFGTAGTFLHSPPMVESSARSARPRLFWDVWTSSCG